MRFLPLSQLGCQRDKQASQQRQKDHTKLLKRCHNQANKGLDRKKDRETV